MNQYARTFYNNSYKSEKYAKMMDEIRGEFPLKNEFRYAETPIFIDQDLKIKLLDVGNHIISDLKAKDFYRANSPKIPSKYEFPDTSTHLGFLCIDFALSLNENASVVPQLIELQAFPSLFSWQAYMAGKFKKHFELPPNYSPYLNRLNTFTYLNELKLIIKGESQEQNTILLDLFPDKQKTQIDFELSKLNWQIEIVCLSELIIENGNIFYLRNNVKHKVNRIYNRLILEEVVSTAPHLWPIIELLKQCQVDWVINPNWYYKVSKRILPYLNHPYIPKSYFVSALDYHSLDLKNFVLKPLYNFGGSGVELNPTIEILDSIDDKTQYILQEKVNYAPIIKTNEGVEIRIEIRMLYIWEENKRQPKLLTAIARLSQNEAIGLNQNQNEKWTGGGVCFFETN